MSAPGADQGRRLGPACAGLPTEWFFPVKETGRPNQATRGALAACRSCPLREACLMGALDRNEEHGTWGGAGEARRRTLRRARVEGRLEATLAAHWRNLDGAPAAPGDAELLATFGPGASHGRAGTYAKGCRCEPCCLAVSAREVRSSLRGRRVPASAAAVA